MGIINFSKCYRDNERGAILPFLALMIPVILAFVGLGTDAGFWMAEKRKLQAAADAAVIAAGWEIANGNQQDMLYYATREAGENGYEGEDANGEIDVEIISQNEDGITVRVILEQDAEVFFASSVYSGGIRVTASADALVTPTDGEFCILALDEESSGAFTTSGTVEVQAPTCSLAVNSNHDTAVLLNGNVDLNFDTVKIAGNYDVRGNSADFNYNALSVNQSRVSDPYSDLETPDFEGCDEEDLRVNADATLSPGVYCGGLDISGNNDIYFEPGVYIMDGGSFKITGGGNIDAEDVTFILTGSGNDYADLDISGSKDITIKAPEEGDEWQGIAFFQDRNAPTGNNRVNKIVGSSEIYLNGTAYFPSQELWFGGGSNTTSEDSPCTRIIANKVTLAGNPLMENQCAGMGIPSSGTPGVKLVR